MFCHMPTIPISMSCNSHLPSFLLFLLTINYLSFNCLDHFFCHFFSHIFYGT